VNRRDVLKAVSRARLIEVAKGFEIAGLTGLSKAEVVSSLARRRSISLDVFLEKLKRDELKAVCRTLGLDDGGRRKQTVIQRIVGGVQGSSGEDAMARKRGGKKRETEVEDYRHDEAKRKNNPPAKIAAEGVVPIVPKARYAYHPRRPPVLQFDPEGKPDKLPELLAEARKRPLNKDEAKLLAEALRHQQPWLEWAEKREQHERGFFEVDPVALHIHERISAQAILKVARRQDVQRNLFADPEQEYQEAVQFYRHDIDWTNRMILGDSLQVMSSLARREDLAGKVQMIYIDPPYGIKFASNFQPEVGKRDVRDREQDLTREPEMVKAYSDTWHLGIHSYLSYLRTRLVAARDLLSGSGSIFVQISDENLHRVRQVMDEVFKPDNFCGVIVIWKTSSATSTLMATTCDYLLWFAKSKPTVDYFQPYSEKDIADPRSGANEYRYVALSSGEKKPASAAGRNELTEGQRYRPSPTTSQSGTEATRVPVIVDGRRFVPGPGGWKTNAEGFLRLCRSGRLVPRDKSISYVRFLLDFPVVPVSDLWMDVRWGFDASEKRYVVETNPSIIQRCMLMTTSPGDLVLDPTCGSGTTAYVAEQRGRRWITIDTSRVAIALARQRLLTAKYDYYEMQNEAAGVSEGFKCKTVPHITLKSIAQNENLDPIFEKHEPILEEKLKDCNAALKKVTKETRTKLLGKLVAKQKKEGKKSVTDADRRRWLLPPENRDRDKAARAKSTVDLDFDGWYHWEAPFDTDPDWPKELRDAVSSYRKAWRAKMDEVNACIAANADQEVLVDQPEVVPGVVRVSGPFTVEAVQPPEMSLGEPTLTQVEAEGKFDGEPEGLEGTFEVRMVETRLDQEAQNLDAYLDQMMRLLRTDGVTFPNNKHNRFTRLEPLESAEPGLHAEGRWAPDGKEDEDPEGKANVCVAFGPQYGPVTAKMVEDVIRSANRMGYDDLVIAGFSFDGASQAVIDEIKSPRLRIHAAHIRPDVNPGMEGLLKEQPGSQLFTVFGQPRTRLDGPDKKGQYTVTMEGVDVYNPVDNGIQSTGADKVAAWFIDGDYDGRTFCITQAFFPDRKAWDKLARALKDVVDPDAFEAFSGTTSLPFPAGKHKRVAVKVIDPRGNEVMRAHPLEH